MKREFLQSLRVGDQCLTKEVIDAIMEENGKDIQASKQWQQKYEQACEQHERELADVKFGNVLTRAIDRAGGRNQKAICALLDLDGLKTAQDPQAAVDTALEELKKSSDYLFEQTQTPPPYARGTGAHTGAETNGPASLAGALREKYERK
jgi:hypothetical protein